MVGSKARLADLMVPHVGIFDNAVSPKKSLRPVKFSRATAVRLLAMALVLTLLLSATASAGATTAQTSRESACSILAVKQSVSPKSASPGDDIGITATIENTCDSEQSTVVALKKDGEKVRQKSVTVAAQSTKMTTFITSFSDPGEHELSINTLDPVTVTIESDNQAPVIDDLQVENPTVEPGESTTVTVSASDPNGDKLDYHWSVSGDWSLSGSGSSVTVTAPEQGGSKGTITVTVFEPDENKSANATVNVTVANESPDSGKQVESIEIELSSDVLRFGDVETDSIEVTVTAHLSNGNSKDVTDESGVTVSSKDPTIVNVEDGELNPHGAGKTELTVEYEGLEASTDLSVSLVRVDQIDANGNVEFEDTEMVEEAEIDWWEGAEDINRTIEIEESDPGHTSPELRVEFLNSSDYDEGSLGAQVEVFNEVDDVGSLSIQEQHDANGNLTATIKLFVSNESLKLMGLQLDDGTRSVVEKFEARGVVLQGSIDAENGSNSEEFRELTPSEVIDAENGVKVVVETEKLNSTLVPAVINKSAGSASEAIARSDGDASETSFQDVLAAISAFNTNGQIGGFEIGFEDVLNAINAFINGGNR